MASPTFPTIPTWRSRPAPGSAKKCLEPLWARFGRISIRSAYRSPAVNDFGNKHNLNCGQQRKQLCRPHLGPARRRGPHGRDAPAIVVHAFLPYYQRTGHWEAIAWWVHDHLPYDEHGILPQTRRLQRAAGATARRCSRIYSYIPPRRGLLTKPGMPNWAGTPREVNTRDWLGEL